MSSIANVVDGQVIDKGTSSDSLTSNKKNSNSELGKDAFLQLLVTQMKYQDPLEPTSNTEYISQLATFSELEEMKNLGSGMEMQTASGLVGKEVIMNVVSPTTGESQIVQGQVDYVKMEGGKVLLSIGGELYSMEDLESVVDKKFLEANEVVSKLEGMLEKLPEPDKLIKNNKEQVDELWKMYENMSAYEKSFLGNEVTSYIKKMKTKMDEITDEKTDEVV